ncbi:MAG TPA: TIGR01777 family oxidoreductase [Candidatus Sulfotelmatobacter sp.]|nr:TIGR01777 family oxidoreductase [Candidatus Sulfotelmatobacter sp.]
MNKRIILAGGSGFIGSALAKGFVARGHQVVVLTRTPRARTDGVQEAEWDGFHLGEWIQFLDGAETVINLTGKSINCPHTPENMRELVSSRVNSVHVVAAACNHVRTPPRTWVQAGAIGFYGDTADRICDEASPAGSDSLAEICRNWETAFDTAETKKTRKVTLRIGVVLGRQGGALPVLTRLTKWFLGGAAGNGKQFVSWIHLSDLVAMFVAAVENDKIAGVYNAVAPAAATNAALMREMRRALHRPWSPPVPAFAIKLGAKLMGSEPSLVLVSQRVAPIRFVGAGFRFQFPKLAPALDDLCQKI